MPDVYRLALQVESAEGLNVLGITGQVRALGVDREVRLARDEGMNWTGVLELPAGPRFLNARLICDDGEVSRVCSQAFLLPDDPEEGSLSLQLVGRDGGLWGVRVDDQFVVPLSLQFVWGFLVLVLAGTLFLKRVRGG